MKSTVNGQQVEVDMTYHHGDPWTGVPPGWEFGRTYIDGKEIYPSDDDYARFEREAEEQVSEY